MKTRPLFSHTPQKGVYANSHNPHFAPYANGTICEAHTMPKGGNIRNTEQSNTEQNNTKSVSPSEHDRLTDEIRNNFKEQIEYDFFCDNWPDNVLGIDTIINYMTEMMVMPYTSINGINQSRQALMPYITKVDSCTIREFLEHMRDKNMSEVKSINSYWRSAFINFLREQELIKLTL